MPKVLLIAPNKLNIECCISFPTALPFNMKFPLRGDHLRELCGSQEASQTVCVLLHASVSQERGSTCPSETQSNSDYAWIFRPF